MTTKFSVFVLFCVAISFTGGCATSTENTPVFEFKAFIGEQRIWKIAEPTYEPDKIGEIKYYSNGELPTRPYIILGRIYGAIPDIYNQARSQVVALAEIKGGDAFIEDKNISDVLKHYGIVITGIGGTVIKFLPDNDTDWSAREEFVEAMQIVLEAANYENGATFDGQTFSSQDIQNVRDAALEKAKRLATEYAKTVRK